MTDETGDSGKTTILNGFSKWFLDTVPGILFFLVVWEVFSRLGDPLELIPGVSSIAYRAYELIFLGKNFSGCVLCAHVIASGWRLFAGMAIASAVGIILGIAMDRSLWAERLLSPGLRILLPIPALVLTLVFMMFLGKSNPFIIYYITAFAAALPIIAATWDGVKTAISVNSHSPQSMDSRREISFWSAIFPASLPCIFAGIRIGLARARTAVVAGEVFIRIQWGLGGSIFDAHEYLDVGFVLVSILAISLLALLIEKLVIRTAEKAAARKWGRMELKIANPGYTLY
jgi:NitT/TauT family transport system permease protein